MANLQDSKNQPAKSFAPGTLDHTRANIGPIGREEAMEMAKKIGGEVLPERNQSSVESSRPRRSVRQEKIRATGRSSSDIAAKSAALSATTNIKSSASVKQIVNKNNSNQKTIKTDNDLPAITAKELKLMDRLMMDPEYEIKPNRGLFNFLLKFSKNREKLDRSYGEYTIKNHVEHMQAFISTIKTFIQLSPDIYKSKIISESDLKFKFLRTVGQWTMRDIKVISIELQEKSSELTVPMLIPFVKEVYKMFLKIYYIGEQQIPALIKEIYADITSLPESDAKKMQMLAKQGITEWLYVYNQIIKGMYPLLMRMCSATYVEFPRFFTSQIADILQFLGLTKFDLLLPEKKKKTEADETKKKAEEKKKAEQRHIAGQKDELVNTGLKLLEQLFPQAGFSHLDKHPDMYPYFQGIYKFEDGFNMLNPENGIQVVVVLLKIIEDLFHGCRNIDFNIQADEKLGALSDKLPDVMSDWSYYYEDLFVKKYGDYLRTFMNSFYSQNDYPSTQYGKENLTNLLWRAKYYFLPNFEFTQLILKKPNNDSKYKPLFGRTDYTKTVLSVLVKRIEENAAGKKPVLGIMNPWNRYIFDLPNNVSKRLDVILGAKKLDDATNATNANLLKYTLCIVSVLDWYINNPLSPAYTGDPRHIYRVSASDGGPEFSVPERTDQNQLFADNLKKAALKQK